MSKLTIELLPWQERAMQMTAPIRVISGGLGSGKNFFLTVDSLRDVYDIQDYFGVICGQTLPIMKKTSIREMQALYKGWSIPYKFNKVDQLMRFPWGAEQAYQSLEIPPDSLRGPEYHRVRIDETSATTEEHVKTMIGRCRKRGAQNITWLFTNPPLFSDHWLHEFITRPDVEMMTVSTYDNPILPIEYIREREMSYPPGTALHKIWMLGEFAKVDTARIFTEFDPGIHVAEIRDYPFPVVRTVGAIDWGFTHDFGFIKGGVYANGLIYITQEYFQNGSLLRDHAAKILQLGLPHLLWSDHDAQSRAEFKAMGIHTMLANKAVEPGIDAMRTRFRDRTIVIHPRCTKLISQLEQYRREEVGGAKVHKENDEGCFAADTLVLMGDGTKKAISTIAAGDVVMTPQGPQEVKGAGLTRKQATVITMRVGKSAITCTLDHRFATGLASPKQTGRDAYTWEDADTLTKTSHPHYLVTKDGVRQYRIEVRGMSTQDVYCLTVPAGCFFLGNGLLVSNCDVLRYIVAGLDLAMENPLAPRMNLLT